MHGIERRALYNLLRMNWLSDPTLFVEPWQVEDYRAHPLTYFFDRLAAFDIRLDRVSFSAYADECDSPEELTDHLLGDRKFTPAQEDEIYLLVFELWRRLMGDKPSLSIVCNELDYQIHLYDQKMLSDLHSLQIALNQFIQVLEENVDRGIAPQEVVGLISVHLANDLEAFLYDFIADQIEEGNENYARELLEEVEPYLIQNKWFKLLRIRLIDEFNKKVADRLIGDLIEEESGTCEIEFNLEFLSLLLERGYLEMFIEEFKASLSLVKQEEDFQDLLAMAIEYCASRSLKSQETQLKELLKKRSSIPLNQAISLEDRDLKFVQKMLLESI